MTIKYVSTTVLFLLFLAACSAPRSVVSTDPDMQYGHRYEGIAPDGYTTVKINKPDVEADFMYFPATFDHVIVRSNLIPLEQDTVAVEILVKGRLPDACMELHAFNQKKTENIITATLEMRRLQSSVCATVLHPYRLYLMLEGGFKQGHYSLRLNDTVVPFRVRQAETEA
ncbi:MAG: hypothetical protein OXE92_00685 [Bacteroidetes bacterium]|nr:hypothetical protein [Bacteroidota bacterium]MCY4204225.1 hypothetical protein [Bacteroidota bacterium]